jgi:hypothetical protein
MFIIWVNIKKLCILPHWVYLLNSYNSKTDKADKLTAICKSTV